METYKKPLIGGGGKEEELPFPIVAGIGFLTGLTSDFTPHPERQRVITERKTTHD